MGVFHLLVKNIFLIICLSQTENILKSKAISHAVYLKYTPIKITSPNKNLHINIKSQMALRLNISGLSISILPYIWSKCLLQNGDGDHCNTPKWIDLDYVLLF